MNRFVYSKLLEWKKRGPGRVLIISGVPGVGKTDLIKKFVESEYSRFLFDSNSSLHDLLEVAKRDGDEEVFVFDNIGSDLDKLKAIANLQSLFPEKFFIIIDSFIRKINNPGIKADYLVVTPLNFEEFLFNCHFDVFKQLKEIKGLNSIDGDLHINLMEIYSNYLVVGGFPEVVKYYKENGLEFNDIRTIQDSIINTIYSSLESSFTWVEVKNIKKILSLIYPTLLRENKKFKVSDISTSRRFKALREFFSYIKNLNLGIYSYIVKDNQIEEDEKTFVLYFIDSGLLGAIGKVPVELYQGDQLLKNPISLALVNNFIACEAKSLGVNRHYNWFHNMSKIEFIFNISNNYVPIEVKDDSSGKLKSFETLNRMLDVDKCYRVSVNGFTQEKVSRLPLYLIGSLLKSKV